MSLYRFQPVLSWLCLICFGLNTTMLSGGLVLCRDGRGGRIELGCQRNERGQCIDSCCSDNGDGQPLDDSAPVPPCQDTPLQGDTHTPKMTARPMVMPVLSLAYVIAMLPSMEVAVPAETWRRVPTARDHPPDSLGRIRTIVLLV